MLMPSLQTGKAKEDTRATLKIEVGRPTPHPGRVSLVLHRSTLRERLMVEPMGPVNASRRLDTSHRPQFVSHGAGRAGGGCEGQRFLRTVQHQEAGENDFARVLPNNKGPLQRFHALAFILHARDLGGQRFDA